MIEVMMTVALLSIGIVMIQQGFLRSAAILSRYSHTMDAQRWIDEKIWEVKEQFFYSDSSSVGDGSGNFEESGKEFHWTVATRPLEPSDLYSVSVKVDWLESGGPAQAAREIYANNVRKV